jgi:hypothetical protein
MARIQDVLLQTMPGPVGLLPKEPDKAVQWSEKAKLEWPLLEIRYHQVSTSPMALWEGILAPETAKHRVQSPACALGENNSDNEHKHNRRATRIEKRAGRSSILQGPLQTMEE